MAVKLETVINAMDLAAQVLTKASVVIEGAKQLGVNVDAVGGAVKGAADGAANGARVVADGIGKGFGVAADGVGAAVGAYRTKCVSTLGASAQVDAPFSAV